MADEDVLVSAKLIHGEGVMSSEEAVLEGPFSVTYFGGKARVASLVWARIGDCDNVIEPFCGSCAFLLARPHAPRIETINDADVMIANVWRSLKWAPEDVAEWADNPVNEADMHAVHRWLVLGKEAAAFRKRMKEDPDYFDAKRAGRWLFGACAWIGSGWAATPESAESEQMPKVSEGRTFGGTGIHGDHKSGKRGPAGGSGERSVILGGGEGQLGHGVHAKGLKHSAEWDQVPLLTNQGQGVHRAHGRPQLADAYSRGRGVHNDNHLSEKRPVIANGGSPTGNGVHTRVDLGTCAERRTWLLDWFGRLRDRLRTVRVCCGDWRRVCDSESVTTRLGVTGIFFDPPYSAEAGRDPDLYAHDSTTVAHDVRRYCLERGDDPQMRIVLAGYAGEGHEELEQHGWECVAWKASGGYGNRSEKGKANAKKERLWVSPHCERGDQPELF